MRKTFTLRDHYVAHGTHAAAAENLDVSPKNYQQWMAGKSKPKKWETITKLVRLGISLENFPD